MSSTLTATENRCWITTFPSAVSVWESRSPVGSNLRRGCVFIADFLHPIVRLDDFVILTLHHGQHRSGKIRPLDRFGISLFRDILAALALGDNRMIVMAGDRGFEVDPTPMQRSCRGSALFCLSA